MIKLLENRINKKEIEMIVDWTSKSNSNRETLLSLAFGGDEKVSSNALWCLTHLRKSNAEWLQSLQNFFIDALLKEKNTARKRMLLQLLREQHYSKDDIRTDFLDFCMERINSECEPYVIRCFSLYISAKLCKFYPELLSELNERVSLLSREPLSPGLRCAIKKVSKNLPNNI